MQDAVKTGTLGRLVAHAVVLVASAGTMIVELVASRLVSKYLGSSLYTWTSVIGIVLGGISLGNWLGGRMADRHSPRRLIPWILLGASALTVLIVVLDAVVGRLVRVLPNDVMSMGILVRSVVLITVMFFLPSTALGMVSPVMARYAIELLGNETKLALFRQACRARAVDNFDLKKIVTLYEDYYKECAPK